MNRAKQTPRINEFIYRVTCTLTTKQPSVEIHDQRGSLSSEFDERWVDASILRCWPSCALPSARGKIAARWEKGHEWIFQREETLKLG